MINRKYIMLKIKHIITVFAAGALVLASCTDSNTTEISNDYGSTQVTSFNLQNSPNILQNLDSVFFTIDLVGARIFNADSLPLGTRIDSLHVSISTDNCSAVELHIPRVGESDSILNYLTNSTDAVDFSNGPVTLHVVSMDHKSSRDYIVKVNVHKVLYDSLQWNLDTPLPMPGAGLNPVASNTVHYQGQYLTVTTDGTSALGVYRADIPSQTAAHEVVQLPFVPRVETLHATSHCLYMLATDGALYSSVDAVSWNPCGVTWETISTTHAGNAVGVVRETDGTLFHAMYPGVKLAQVAKGFPLSGTSQTVTVATKWSTVEQEIIVGGRTADNSLVGSSWAFDGQSWVKLGETLDGVEGLTVFPYYCCSTDSATWEVTDRSVLMALGGRDASGKPCGDVHISYNMGFDWQLASKHNQLPDAFPAYMNSRAFIVNQVNNGRSIRPITEWDTPYIYLYEGLDMSGHQGGSILRGVLLNKEIKPIQ